MSGKNLYLIDATAFCYRAFYALRDLSTSYGQPTNAVFGFVNMLQKILKNSSCDYIAACFDISRDTFRQKKFAQYKIQRPPMPEGLSSQIPLIKEIVAAYGIAIFEKEGYEADDVIASLSRQASLKGLHTTIVSSDKDILQLVNDNVRVFSPYKDEGALYTEKEVRQRFGVEPGAIPDIIALMGDDTDNIPGVPGIGEKTAVSLIKEFGSIEKLLKHIDAIPQEKIRQSIRDNTKTVTLSKELAILNHDLDLKFDLENLKSGSPNTRELTLLFKRLEFKKFLKSLHLQGDGLAQDEAPTRDDGNIPESILKGQGELVVYIDGRLRIILGRQGEVAALEKLGVKARKLLADRKVKKIGHDLKGVILRLKKEGVSLEGVAFDTMIASYLVNPSGAKYSLSECALNYLDEMVEDNPSGSLRLVKLIEALKSKLEQELNDKDLAGLFRDTEMPLVEVLAYMEFQGIRLDVELLRKLSLKLEKKLVGLIEDIYALSGCEFNINSPKQLREVLFEKLKLPVVKRSKTGPSTDEEVLNRLAASHKLPALLVEYRQLTKLKNTYIDTLPQMVSPETGRLHTSFNQAGTETGRLSSSNPNLQNVPIKTEIGSQIRRAVVASGAQALLFSFDYSQIELRILAHLSKDENLIAAFKEGKDIHRTTASLIYGVEEKDVDPPMREAVKRINFGIVYGLSSWGLSRDLKIPVEEAQRFIEAYFARYPKVEEYIQAQIKKAKKDGFVTTILGRRRYLPEINDKNQGIRQFAERKAVNTPIQGSASDLIKLAMVRIYRKLVHHNSQARMILQIHDELLFDVPKAGQADFVESVRGDMEDVLPLAVPVKVSIKKGVNWLDMEEVK